MLRGPAYACQQIHVGNGPRAGVTANSIDGQASCYHCCITFEAASAQGLGSALFRHPFEVPRGQPSPPVRICQLKRLA
ncbi:hypothetical protein R1flu_018947 [Riccia fluitans]|uniref:Uncharacterized protein n=1 Tax=Riccia fluitans TaxID=41844 RepID=A0ABD1ZHA2_9MARC